jgi:phage terminase large subunit
MALGYTSSQITCLRWSPAKLAPLFTAANKRYRSSNDGRGSAKTRTFAMMTAIKACQAMMNRKSGVILWAREFMN